MKMNSPFGFLKLFLTEKRGAWPRWVETSYGPRPPERIQGDQLSYTFINHATVLIQTAGLNILTDPIWSNRCSPVSWAGPRRHRNPGIRFEDLPPIDLVLISHNHYDHMDIPTLRKLAKQFNSSIFVGDGNLEPLAKKGFDRVREFGWWQDADVGSSVQVTFVPARHFSGRGLFDRNKTLWGGFVLQTPFGVVYFAGDTGYADCFSQIYKKFGPSDLSFLPIGAYKPRSFMCAVHMDPADAVKAHADLHSSESVGIHFGTFRLAFEGLGEPEQDLNRALESANVPADSFVVPECGESKDMSNKTTGLLLIR